MVASITRVHSPRNLLLDQVLICYCRSYESPLVQISINEIKIYIMAGNV
jgi:hypothetical protein